MTCVTRDMGHLWRQYLDEVDGGRQAAQLHAAEGPHRDGVGLAVRLHPVERPLRQHDLPAVGRGAGRLANTATHLGVDGWDSIQKLFKKLFLELINII